MARKGTRCDATVPAPRPAATAVGDAEGLQQVEVAHVGAIGAGLGQAHLGIEVGAIEVDLTAVRMHQRADLGIPFEHPGGRVGDHQGRQLIPVAQPGLQVRPVDIPWSSQATATTLSPP